MALVEMIMPKMGESIMEGTILKWLKKVGDKIGQDESILEVATDKVDTEIPATHAGVLKEILVQENEVVAVGKAIAIIDTAPNQQATPEAPATANTPEPTHTQVSEPEEVSKIEENISYAEAFTKLEEPQPDRFYSPLVLNIAREEKISMDELSYIPGTGKDDRVTKKDIMTYIQFKTTGYAPAANTQTFTAAPIETEKVNMDAKNALDTPVSSYANPKETTKPVEQNSTTTQEEKKKFVEITPKGTKSVEAIENSFESEKTPETEKFESPKIEEKQPVYEEVTPKVEFKAPVETETPKITINEPQIASVKPAISYSGKSEIIEMDRMRKMIAQRMVESKQISPHVTSFVEADVTNIVYWRNKVKKEFMQKEGDTLTYTPIFIEAVAKAIKDYPMINASVEGDKIIIKKDINVGMAVALPTGNLIVPVIKNADQYNLVGLTKKVNDLAKRARENKLTPDDLTNGTYTTSNVGSFGNVMGTPIIMQPQVAILAFGAIQKKPAVIETPYGDSIGVRHMMFLSHSYDHRVVDGALGGMFVRRVADYLENFDVNRILA